MRGEAEQLTIKIKIMKEQFVPYKIALKLKELGFDEECLAYYYKHGNSKKEKLFYYPSQDEYDIDDHPYLEPNSKTNSDAPLWQQAFDWFRDKYNLVSEIFHNPEYEWKNWKYRFYWTTERLRLSNISDGHYETYEEARLECLKKLIKIVELEK